MMPLVPIKITPFVPSGSPITSLAGIPSGCGARRPPSYQVNVTADLFLAEAA